jgi:hypothetical protein
MNTANSILYEPGCYLNNSEIEKRGCDQYAAEFRKVMSPQNNDMDFEPARIYCHLTWKLAQRFSS